MSALISAATACAVNPAACTSSSSVEVGTVVRTHARSVAKLTDASTPSRSFSLLSRRAAQLPHDIPRTVSHTSRSSGASVWAKLLTTTSLSVSLQPGVRRPGPNRYTTTCSSRAILDRARLAGVR